MKDNIVTVIGSLNFDIIFKQQRLPQVGETLMADHVACTGGGKGANQAVQCAKLGVTTYMVGAVGQDFFGNFLVSELEKYGVSTQYIQRVTQNTGLAAVNALTDGTIFATISNGANYTLTPEYIDQLRELLAKSKIVILQLEIPLAVVEYIIAVASECGCFIILNAAPALPLSAAALAKVNCLVVNEPEASFYCGATIVDLATAEAHCDELWQKIKDMLIITLGDKGSLLYDGATKLHIPAKQVAVVETTGAGDSYIGALASRLLAGCAYQEAAEFATRVSAITVTEVGAQPAMPDRAKLTAFWAEK